MQDTNITLCIRPSPKASQTLPTVIALFFKLEIISRLDGKTVIDLRLAMFGQKEHVSPKTYRRIFI